MADDDSDIIEVDVDQAPVVGDSDEEEEYVVEAIRAWRYDASELKIKYLIKWKNWSEQDNSWEPEENLTNCGHILAEYKASLRGEDLAHFNHPQPDEMNGFQRHAQYVECVGADGPHDSDLDEDSDKPERQKFYCLVRFDDDGRRAEDVTLNDLFDNLPDEAFKFCERRLLARK